MEFNKTAVQMKRITVFLTVFLSIFMALPPAQAQFVHKNAFQLPIHSGEVTFLQNDTATALYADDFYPIAKAWISKHYPAAKFSKEKKDNPTQLETTIYFKIDDQHVQAPLYYQGTLHLKWKDQVIQIKLDQLHYTPGQPKGKSKKNSGSVDVSFQVKQQVLAGADKLYPHSWDSLNEYGAALLDDFSKYIQYSAAHML